MTEIIFEIFINMIEALISVDFITRYLGKKWNDNRNNIAFIIVWIISFVQMTIMNHITEFETYGSYIPMIIYIGYAFICLNGSIALKILFGILTQLIIILTAIMTNLLLCNLIGYEPYKMITIFNSTRVIGVIITKLFQFYVTRLILRNRYKNPVSGYRLATIIVIPTISAISLCSLMKAILINNDISPYVITGMICIIVANVMTYYFFTVINKDYENALRTKLLEQQNENLKNKIADNEAFVNEMKTVRHDIKHQLFTALKYIDDEKDAEAKEYIGVLTNNYLPHILSYIDTGNTAFDAIVNAKIAVCNQKHIFMEVNIKNGTNFIISPAEIAVLFGNLLDNAIEAAQFTYDKRITLDIHTTENYLIISVKNSIKSSILQTNEELITSKNDKELHGIGIKSVKNIVNKHNGMIQFYEEENQFCCHIMIAINE